MNDPDDPYDEPSERAKQLLRDLEIEIYETSPISSRPEYILKVWEAGATYRATLIDTKSFEYLTLRKEEWESVCKAIELGARILESQKK